MVATDLLHFGKIAVNDGRWAVRHVFGKPIRAISSTTHRFPLKLSYFGLSAKTQ
jgi:hypothetical protein